MDFLVWEDSLISESAVVPAGFLPKTQGAKRGIGINEKPTSQ